MKQKLIRLSQRYAAALRAHLQPGAHADLLPALALGRQAVGLGMETLELARMHERAVAELAVSQGKHGQIKRAEIFFNEATLPIVESHRAARQSKANLHRLTEILSRRTRELAATNRLLKHDVIRRKRVEVALKQSGVHYTQVLRDSMHLQEELRQLTHQVLATQEEERKKISLELQDEVAQTLLGINVRLLSLKQESQVNTQGLKSKIASTRQLVTKSAKSVRRVAREFRTL